MKDKDQIWPALPVEQWEPTRATLHRWSQIVGKVRMAFMPWMNHSWHVPLYVSVRGLSTSLIPHGDGGFELEFDFCDHKLYLHTTDRVHRSIALAGQSVASFYEELTRALDDAGVHVNLLPVPVEIPGEVERFEIDQRNAYDGELAERFWRILLQVNRVLTNFRARFIGKVSPVHFFWGGFDMAVTRFSGRTAPRYSRPVPHMPHWVMEEAYSHEVSSAGFWSGTEIGGAAFYSYAYPEPKGFRDYPVRPKAAYYHAELGEFILPYDAVREADDPDTMVLEFLQTTYEAAAESAKWDRAALERMAPVWAKI
jgi:hypothetical protein